MFGGWFVFIFVGVFCLVGFFVSVFGVFLVVSGGFCFVLSSLVLSRV